MAALDFERDVAPHRGAVRAYCYRLLGTLADADDAAQDALVRAWKAKDSFEARASVKTWLFTIASRVCFDLLASRKRRALPDSERGPAEPSVVPTPEVGVEWLEPLPDAWLEEALGPDATVERRESVGLAFLVALQALPPLQRAALVLREVLGHSAIETAEVLDTTVPAVNSALQRARAALDGAPKAARASAADEQALLGRYLRAWEMSDVQALVATLRDDASLVMPPMGQWFQGAANVGAFLSAPFILAPAVDAQRFRAVPISAAGRPALAVYRRAGPGQPYLPDSVHVLEVEGGRIRRVMAYLTPALHARFGLGPEFDAFSVG